MRKFSLENKYGERLDMNNADKTCFFYSPTGMGYDLDSDYVQLGSIWIPNNIKDAQNVIGGTLIFRGSDPYALNYNFLKYIRNSGEDLKFIKNLPSGEYLRDVDLVKYEETEINLNGVLEVPVEFKCKTLWYQSFTTSIIISSEPHQNDGKVYAFSYDYHYNQGANGVAEVENNSSIPVGFSVIFDGPVTNPIISVSYNNEVVGTVAITGSASSGESIHYSSIDDNLACYLHTELADVNLAPGLSLDNENFFKLPIGRNKILVTAEGGLAAPVVVSFDNQYRAV